MISGAIKVDGREFKWMESGNNNTGGGNRAILINPGNHMYWFAPNPHDDGSYNKKQQKFYNEAASFIEDKANWTHNKWPASITDAVGVKFAIFGVEYSLTKVS